MSQWADFYRDRMNDRYRQHVASRYGEFIDMVHLAGMSCESVVEMGCGAGNISREVAKRLHFAHVTLADKDPEILKLCRENMASTGLDNWMIVQNDFLQDPPPGKFDLVYAHGVLEHFDDDQIRKIIEAQLAMAPRVIHYVPSDKYKTPSFGDERLLTPYEWKFIANPNKVMSFNDGFDLALEWRRG